MKRIPSDDLGGGVRTPLAEPDAHGQAALMLTESILHALVENGSMTATLAASTARTASEVKREVAMMLGESRERMQESIDLLGKIERSFASHGVAR